MNRPLASYALLALTLAVGNLLGPPPLLAAMPTPPRAVRVVDRLAHPWQSQQVQEPCILPNPKQPGQLVIFYSGVPETNRSIACIGKAWATATDPLIWHEDAANPVFSPGTGESWDRGSIRLDCVVHVAEEDAYYIYYSGTKDSIQDRIGLAICPVGADGYGDIRVDRIRRHGTAPVLSPEPAAPFHEEMASQAAVWRERDPATGGWRWFMYYSYRGKDGILPGLRLATSADGKSWTRHFNPADPRGMGQIFVSTPDAYYEWHQISKIGSTYVLCIEVGKNRGERWRPVFAVSDRPDRGWRQLDIDFALQSTWPGVYRDDAHYHVATPAIYGLGGRWYLFVQACPRPSSNNYIDGRWDLWGFDCPRALPIPGTSETLHLPGGS